MIDEIEKLEKRVAELEKEIKNPKGINLPDLLFGAGIGFIICAVFSLLCR